MDAAGLRARFPVLSRYAYLNAGTDGPVPARAVEAARAALDHQLAEGRWTDHFDARHDGYASLRGAYAGVLGCSADDVALTTSTSEGLGKVLAGLDLGPGDEIVTSDQEHPGLLGPLAAARARGVHVRMGQLARLAEAVRPSTTLVACSHVGWVSGEVADPALRDTGVPVVFDGAQGAGAVPVDVAALGCAAYAAAGQKWLCGADGTGMLYLSPAFAERVRPVAPGYMAFADPGRGLEGALHPGARRHDTPALPREAVAMTIASAGVLAEAGWEVVHARGRELAARLAEMLAARGRTVGPRGATTLVAWEEDDPVSVRDRLAARGVVVRDLPGTTYVRASVGAWNDETDLDRLLEAL